MFTYKSHLLVIDALAHCDIVTGASTCMLEHNATVCHSSAGVISVHVGTQRHCLSFCTRKIFVYVIALSHASCFLNRCTCSQPMHLFSTHARVLNPCMCCQPMHVLSTHACVLNPCTCSQPMHVVNLENQAS